VLAWDQEVAALARDQELDQELKTRLAAQQEERRQRSLMREEARAGRTVARRILLRMLRGVDAGQLDEMGVADLLPHLQKVSALLEVSQKLDRLFGGEPTEVTRQEIDARGTVRRLVAIMQQFVLEERWEELAQRLDRLEADG
jgi:hypothetical protein